MAFKKTLTKLEIKLNPIGIVHTLATENEVRERVLHKSLIEIYPEFEQGLEGLAGFSHIFVIGYFNNLRPEQKGPLKVRPKSLLRFGFKLEEIPLLGVFALDSPTRPNPIGLSLVSLEKIDGRNLTVSGLDYFDGTPVLDVKPYQPDYRVEGFTLPEWHTKFSTRTGGHI